jgi:hypothetical protein
MNQKFDLISYSPILEKYGFVKKENEWIKKINNDCTFSIMCLDDNRISIRTILNSEIRNEMRSYKVESEEQFNFCLINGRMNDILKIN